MRILHLSLGLMLCLFFTSNVNAQIHECGFTPSEESIEFTIENHDKWLQFKKDYLSNPKPSAEMDDMVPVKLHIIQNSDGSGGLTEEEAMESLQRANPHFKEINIQFEVCGEINIIKNTQFMVINNFKFPHLIFQHYEKNVLNIYFADEVFSGPLPLCGFANGPEQTTDAIVLANSCATNESTTVHEIGHYFGLFHTHETNLGKELVTRSDNPNCETAGDGLCDTPADPDLKGFLPAVNPTGNPTGFEGLPKINSQCFYKGQGIEFDSNGDTYDPDTRNIMSGSRKPCRDQFTEEQYAKMRMIYEEFHAQMSCDGDVTVIPPNGGGNNGGGGNTGGGGNNGGGNTNPPPTVNPAEPYCESSSTNPTGGYIREVRFSGMKNTTNSDGGYGDYTNRVATVNQDETYEVVLVPKLNINSSTGWKVWIDFDQSESFEINELVTSVDFENTNFQSYIDNVTIPEDAKVGLTRMRVVYGIGASPVECGKFINGETEDYSIQIDAKIIPGVCAPKGSNSSSAWIKRIQINTLDNETGDDGGYADYSQLNGAVVQGEVYPLRATQGGNNGNFRRWKIWVDFNQDQDFDDNGEKIYEGFTWFSNPTLTKNLFIPNNILGELKMRVATGIYAGPGGPCDDIAYGDIEDYTLTVNKDYCSATGGNTNYEWIDNVIVNTADGQGNFENNSGNDGGYGDYTFRTLKLNQTINYPFMLVPGFSGGAFDEIWTVWIDLNIDGDFEDAGEMVFQTQNPTKETAVGTLTVPDNSMLGTTRMRVAINWFNTSTGTYPSACGTINDGEYEDYTVEILPEDGMADYFDVLPFDNILDPVFEGERSVEPREGFQMNLFPNPSTGFSTVRMDLNLPREVEIQVYSIAGVLQKSFFIEETQNIDYLMDLRNLGRGTYLIQVRGDDFSEAQRLIVLK